MTVEGWSRDSIEVHARIQPQGATDEDAAALARDIKVVTSGARIGAEGPPSGRRRSWSVSFVIYAPRRSDLSSTLRTGRSASGT